MAPALEQSVEVVPHHGAILAAVLKQKSGQRRLHQAVLIPLGMTPHKIAHGVVEILR